MDDWLNGGEMSGERRSRSVTEVQLDLGPLEPIFRGCEQQFPI